MSDHLQQSFKNMALNEGLLSTHFQIQTKWHVITGASSSGKTTLIDLLAKKGFKIAPETGRQYFEGELAKGRTIDDIRKDRAAMTREIYALWLELTNRLAPSETTFLDRGLPDSLSFYRFADMDPNRILLDCFQHRYASVFLLDRLAYQQDGIRGGDDESAAYFDAWMENDYRALGYKITRVPVLPPDERLAFILEKLSDDGLIAGSKQKELL